VVASFDFDAEDETREAMPLEDFLDVVAEWRDRVLASASKSATALPETYRRNPLA
jgi:hypothetical protein